MKWKGFDQDEGQDVTRAEKDADKYLVQKKRFEGAWHKIDQSKA